MNGKLNQGGEQMNEQKHFFIGGRTTAGLIKRYGLIEATHKYAEGRL
jgi:hypothetical protein